MIFRHREQLFREAAERFARAAERSAASGERFSVALAGGKTPIPMHRLLAEQPYRKLIPWARVHLFWSDERCVPPSDAASNYKRAKTALLDHVPLPQGNVHRIPGEREPQASARSYETELRTFFRGERVRFDLVILGVGADGHTASLFPDTPALREEHRLAVATTAPEGTEPRKRVSLTLPVINAARSVLFLVTGSEKADIVHTVLEQGRRDLPAGRVCPEAGRLTWLVDVAAGSRLSGISRAESGG